jgi:hypothetical protein
MAAGQASSQYTLPCEGCRVEAACWRHWLRILQESRCCCNVQGVWQQGRRAVSTPCYVRAAATTVQAACWRAAESASCRSAAAAAMACRTDTGETRETWDTGREAGQIAGQARIQAGTRSNCSSMQLCNNSIFYKSCWGLATCATPCQGVPSWYPSRVLK